MPTAAAVAAAAVTAKITAMDAQQQLMVIDFFCIIIAYIRNCIILCDT